MACPGLASSDRSIAAYTAANTGRIFNRILRPASESGREAIGPVVEAEGALQPGQCLRGSTRPHKDGAAEGIVVGIARIELEHAVDLCEGEKYALERLRLRPTRRAGLPPRSSLSS